MAATQTFLQKMLEPGVIAPSRQMASFAGATSDASDTGAMRLQDAAAAALPGPDELIGRVRQGLPAKAFDLLAEALEVSADRLARLLHIAPRTLARRSIFKPDESDRILRLGCLFQRTCEVLGGETAARAWLQTPQWALNGAMPLDLADTEPGAREVERLLGRIEHGVVA